MLCRTMSGRLTALARASLGSIGAGTNTVVKRRSRQGERTRKRMEGLQRMTALLAKVVGVKQVVEAVLQNGLETVGAYAGGVFLIDEHGQQLVLQG